ncbi:MAG: type I restriction enzyme HsdR N-terminal domain-containing protein [Bacteroidaceae bacterium]|nr:type I restriction enzyme HsdR N-terminal domain-containing protein [Bacteroidaceae bacterium]
MLKLNLPAAKLKIERRKDKLFVWDYIRLRWIALTPEEWVRQHFSLWLTQYLGYPQQCLGHEISLQLNGMKRRADAVLFTPEGRPTMILEFKAPHINITQKTFDQIGRYNMVMQVPYLIVSNGMQHYCCKVNDEGIDFLKDIPHYTQLMDKNR